MTAHQLQERVDCDITLFESSQRLGGKIRTATFNTAPVLYEAGAAELYDYSQVGRDPLAELVQKFGLPRRPIDGRTVILGDLILKNDQDIRRDLGESAFGALKDFTSRATSLISPAEYYESDWQADNQDPLARQTFADLLEFVPDELARHFIRTAIHSDLATEPHHTNAMYGLQNFLMNEPGYMSLYTIDGGIERIIHELVRRTTARIELGRQVMRVEKMPGDMYRITSRHRREMRADDFDFVVAALPNNWLPAIDWAGDKLCRAMQSHHRHYDHPAHYLRVSVLFEKPFWRDRIAESYFMSDAFGGCCVYDESARLDRCAFGVLGWLLAGESALNMTNLDDTDLINRVIDSLPTELGDGRSLMLEAHVHRWVGSVNGLPAGFPAREPDARHLPEPEEHPDLFVVGDYLFDSTLNGVMDSADTVAEWIADEIQSPEPVGVPSGEFAGST
jgi:monoamine oxidase